MHYATNILLAIAVLAHSLAGCCWHHAHAQEPSFQTRCCSHRHTGASADQHAAIHHSETAAAPHAGDRAVPIEPVPGGCQEGSCVFLRDGGAPAVAATPMLALDSSAAIVSDLGLSGLRMACASGQALQAFAPPARLHLLHQILLV